MIKNICIVQDGTEEESKDLMTSKHTFLEIAVLIIKLKKHHKIGLCWKFQSNCKENRMKNDHLGPVHMCPLTEAAHFTRSCLILNSHAKSVFCSYEKAG